MLVAYSCLKKISNALNKKKVLFFFFGGTSVFFSLSLGDFKLCFFIFIFFKKEEGSGLEVVAEVCVSF